uniref:receptor-like protein kinase HERK 1 n=1 Tax=Erigeron canadensis TaxID=72917 RepID=UPI001CB8C09E|nr:receptor-like protein kinase HERK 1 [Erigeron canadensis]
MSATDNFSKTYQIPFTGDYDLYRAELEHFDEENHSIKKGENKRELPKRRNYVVIKRILPREDEQEEQVFYTEVKMLDTCKHPNIVKLLGLCVEGSEMILVIEHLSNGYLLDGLLNTGIRHTLTWVKRLRICLDVANALNYIHIHSQMGGKIRYNIKSAYIGLDENWDAKVIEFGLSGFWNQVDQGLHPTRDHIYHTHINHSVPYDPEYSMTGMFKRETTVYSFGVLLFEVLCGSEWSISRYFKKVEEGPISFVSGRRFQDGTISMEKIDSYETLLMEMIDPILKKESGENNFIFKRKPNKDSLQMFVEIAHKCIAETQERRPTLEMVIQELQKALSFEVTLLITILLSLN